MRRVVLVMLCLSVVGCGSADRIARANDLLRIERETQDARIASLESELAETRAKLRETNGRLESPVPADVLDALPRVASIEIGRLSLIEPSRAIVFVTPRDGRGRFVQTVATLEVRVIGLGDEPGVLSEVRLGPLDLRDAFASGLGGASYRIVAPFADGPTPAVTVTVSLHDHITGTKHTAERTLTSGSTADTPTSAAAAR